MEKILITGTGRCGTTFLIKLFSFLNFDTGFNKENFKSSIFSNCNSGMERCYKDNHYILKNPTFLSDIDAIVKDESIRIKYVIIPIREFKASANSRVKHGFDKGGLWNAIDESSQLDYFKEIMSNYIFISTKFDIETIFIDFEKMISNKKYLFEKLLIILKEKYINFKTFSHVYDEVSITCQP